MNIGIDIALFRIAMGNKRNNVSMLEEMFTELRMKYKQSQCGGDCSNCSELVKCMDDISKEWEIMKKVIGDRRDVKDYGTEAVSQ